MNREKLQRAIAHNPNFTASRKTSLYSNFARLEESNPDGYEANILAWREVLDEALRDGAFADKTCVEASPELLTSLHDPQNGTPLSLGRVFDAMVADNSLMPLSQFTTMYPPTAPSPSLLSRATGVLGWAAGLLQRRNWVSTEPGTDALKPEKYVSMKLVRTNAAKIVHRLIGAAEEHGNSQPAHVFTREQVRDLLDPGFSDLDIRCCLAVARASHQINYDDARNIVKLARAGQIDETDVAITGLRAQIAKLTARESALAAQIAEHEHSARDKIKTNRKAAKGALLKKQMAEKSYDRVLGLLDQLETVMQKIDDASDNKQALAALQSSAALLDQLNRGTKVDAVDEAIESLQDAVADTNEVTSSIADLRLDSPVDRDMEELDLDNELEQMAEEEQSKELATKIPDAPKHRPGAERQSPEAERDKAQQEIERPAETLAHVEA